MKRLTFGFCVLLATTHGCAAAGWQQQGDRFVLAHGQRELVYRPGGVLSVGLHGQRPVDVGIFLWHDNWVYERLEAGQVAAGPQVDSRGVLRQRGTWVVRENAPPMTYDLVLQPTATGATLRLTTTKTAPLKLPRGIWCRLTVNRGAFAGRQLYARPVAHSRVGQPLSATCEAFLVGLGNGQAAAFTSDGFREMRSRIDPQNQVVEMNLVPGDFPPGKPVTATLTIRFDRMPTRFPGDVRPQREALRLVSVTPTSGTAPQYGKLALRVDLRGTWDNPYDPDDVALDAVVTTASGKELKQPGFFLVDQERRVKDGVEVMAPRGQGRWEVRLAAMEPGPLRCRLIARDRSGTVTREVGPFQVTPGANKGFVRRSRIDPHYLQFDNGEGFLPIGHNLPIYHTSGQLAEDAIRKMAAAGENYNRWWLSRGGLGLEWEPTLGWYRQAQAARLDRLLDLADKLDFYYMLCLDTHQDFRQAGWKANPFNAANGGPCKTVSEWFTNDQARAFYKKRLRYLVARWGYSPHVLCWEFGNEFEGWANTSEKTKLAWHRDMAKYLAALDPYHHLLTTSWWSKTGPEACWRIPQLGIVQTHCYTNNDANVAEQVRQYCLFQWTHFQKPHLFGEFGIRSHSTTADKDPKGWALHNAFWAAVCSGCCGIPMPWWHESYIDPLNLYFHFTALARFTKDVPFGTAPWRQVQVASLEYVTPPSPLPTRDIVLTPTTGWGRPDASEFHVGPDGSLNHADSLHALLQGQGHRDLRNPPTFVVNYPRPGRFVVGVGRVSNSGHLKIFLDGRLELEREFPCGKNHGKEWVYRPQWKLWESVYDEEVSVDAPAGTHRLRVENTGKDWLRVTRYVFEGCKVIDRPDLLAAALSSPDLTLVWIQNRRSTWFNHHRADTGQGPKVSPVPPSRVTLSGVPDGEYQVQWWETWRGRPLRTEQAVARGGRLVLQLKATPTDIAAKLIRR